MGRISSSLTIIVAWSKPPTAIFKGVTWQRCQAHFTRNITSASPQALQKEIAEQVRLILTAPDVPTARVLLNACLERYDDRAPQAMQIREEGFDHATAILVLPSRYRRRLRTTNSEERLNQELRRRERVIRIFPNRASALRLLGAVLMEQHEQWSTGRTHLDMTKYHQWCAARDALSGRETATVTRSCTLDALLVPSP